MGLKPLGCHLRKKLSAAKKLFAEYEASESSRKQEAPVWGRFERDAEDEDFLLGMIFSPWKLLTVLYPWVTHHRFQQSFGWPWWLEG